MEKLPVASSLFCNTIFSPTIVLKLHGEEILLSQDDLFIFVVIDIGQKTKENFKRIGP
jgi:hypothetical protein